MTVEKFIELLNKLTEIANSDSIAAKKAKLLMQAEMTTHNAEEIEKLVSAFDRNR